MGNRHVQINHQHLKAKVPNYAPSFVLELFKLIRYGRGSMKGDKKKVFLAEYVYIIEPISHVEYCRRRRLHLKLEIINHVANYEDMYWYRGMFYGRMKRYDMDLFEYLREDNVDVSHLIKTLVPTLRKLHADGIYLQDIKPENIFVDICTNHIKFFFADVDYAFMKRDFPLFVHERPWVRTKHFSPELGKPQNKVEAIRNDLYAMAVMIGRIETFYINGDLYNVFTKPRGRIMSRDFDDRWKMKKDYVYATYCANFIMSGMHYRHIIKRFLYTLETANNNSS